MSSVKKVYRKVLKTLHIDSRDRNPLSTPSKYSIKLPNTYENIYSITLKSAEIPISWYAFSEALGNNKFTVTVTDDMFVTTTLVITIPDGNYTSTTFPVILEAVLNDVAPAGFGASTCAVGFDITTYKLLFQAAATVSSFSFDFAEQIQSICGTPGPVPNTTTWWGLGYFMGFNKVNILSSVYSAGPPVAPATLSSSFVVQLDPYNYIIMELDFMNKQDETPVDGIKSGRIDGCFAKIPMSGNSGDIIFFRDYCCPSNRSVMSPPLSQLKTINVKLRGHNGIFIDFNNVDHSFTLEMEFLENNFDEYSSLNFAPLH